MKRLFISSLIIILLVALMSLHVNRLEQFTGNLIQQLETAVSHIEKEEWAKAEKTANQVMSQWEQHAFYLHTTLRHTDIDDIRISLKEMLAYLGSSEDQAECLAVSAKLINQLELLLEAEQLTIKNLL